MNRTTWSKGCTHNSATRVFKTGKAHVWAGSRSELLELPRLALVVSAVGFVEFTKNPITATATAKELLPATLFEWAPPPCIGIEWPDRGVPALGAQWWRELTKTMKGLGGNVGLCCFGGHGRTGTMLAILAALSDKVKKGDCPVAWVRARYCASAVESNAQANYVEQITGLTVSSDPSDAGVGVAALPLGGPAAGRPIGASPQPVHDTGTGSRSGALVGTDPTDEELLDAWYQTNDYYIEYATSEGEVKRVEPVWDDKGEMCGWVAYKEEELDMGG